MIKLKNLTKITLTAILCFSIALLGLGGHYKFYASAADSDTENGIIVNSSDIGLTNGEFNDVSGSYGLTVPLSWSSAAISGTAAGVVSGVVDTELIAFNTVRYDDDDTFKLKDYDNFIKPPLRAGTNVSSKALFINNTNLASFGYMSETISLEANSYYAITAWVFTCDFDDMGSNQNSGAYIRLNGSVFATTGMINTANTWQKYTIYVETPTSGTASAGISLQLGDGGPLDTDFYNPARGYAFFDGVTVYPVSLSSFRAAEAEYSQYTTVVRDERVMIEPAFNNPDFQDASNLGWDTVVNTANAAILNVASSSYSLAAAQYGLKENPYTPFDIDNNVFMIASSYPGFATFKSNEITITRHKYYRISVFTFNSISEGSASVMITSDDENPDEEAISFTANVPAKGNTNDWKGKWVETTFYVQGSTFYDRVINMELCYGSEAYKARGAVYFDHITVQEILPAVFSVNSENGTVVSFYAPAEGSVANGGFNMPGNYEEYSYPMVPQYWTGINTADNDRVVSGIISTDIPHFNTWSKNYGNVDNPRPSQEPRNMLMVWNKFPTYSGYYSPSFTLAANSYQKISVNLATQLNINSDNGAFIVLTDGTHIYGMFEDIDNNHFSDFSFYIANGNTERTLYLNIMLGTVGDFSDKTALGYMFIDEVTGGESTKEEYDASNSSLTSQHIDLRTILSATAYSNSYVKVPLDWTFLKGIKTEVHGVTVGIIDLNNFPTTNGLNEEMGSITKNKIGVDSRYPDGPLPTLVLHSPYSASIGVTTSAAIEFEADTYVSITVRIKTVGIPEGFGASIIIGNKSSIIEINTEYFLNNVKNDFIDYTFYINVGSTADSQNLEIWLGNGTKTKYNTEGYVFVDNISITTINETTYSEGIAKLDVDEDEGEVAPANIKKVIFSETVAETSEQTQNPGQHAIDWWVLPSILFGGFLILVLLIIGIRKAMPLLHLKRVRKGAISYDRKYVKPVKIDLPETEEIITPVPEVKKIEVKPVKPLKPVKPAFIKPIDEIDRFDD